MRFVKKDHKICDSIMADQSSIIQFKKISGDSIQSITQFNCQVIIHTSPTRKVPENCMKCVQNRPKRFFFQNWKYRFNIRIIFIFFSWIQFKRLLNIIFSKNIQFKISFNYSFSREIQFKNWFKKLNLAWFNSTKYSFN